MKLSKLIGELEFCLHEYGDVEVITKDENIPDVDVLDFDANPRVIIQ